MRADDAPETVPQQSPLLDWTWRDEKKEAHLIQEIVQRGVFLVPTLASFEAMSLPGAAILSEDRLPPGLPATMKAYWERVQKGLDARADWSAACRLHLDHAKAFIKKAATAGAMIAAGSGT